MSFFQKPVSHGKMENGGGCRCGRDCTYDVWIFDLSANAEFVLSDHGYDTSGVDHVLIFLLAQELIVALHDAVEASAEELHVLGLHDMAERVLMLSP